MLRCPPRLAGLALLALSLAGCFGGTQGGNAGQRPYTAVARFVPGDDVSVIQITVRDRKPLRGADLIGPDGAVIAAESIEARPGVESGQTLFGGPLGTDISNDVGLTTPLGAYGTFAPAGSQSVNSGQIVSTAVIRLTDPVSYLKDWRFWQVRLRMGDPPTVSFVSLPAPQPPPSL
jgi:hypothetical protein